MSLPSLPSRPPPSDPLHAARWQHRLPLCAQPFAVIAQACGRTESSLITELQRARQSGALSRVGPVFAPGRVGRSTLVAMAVDPAVLDNVAAAVSARTSVNHNYEREHRFNLWFVVTMPDAASLQAELHDLRQRHRWPLLDLPMLRSFHIDLGFAMDEVDRNTRRAAREPRTMSTSEQAGGAPALDAAERALIAALEAGMPLEPRPYQAVAHRAGMTETAVIGTIERWLTSGVLSRFGLVWRHHEFGYQANAMCVFDLDEARTGPVGMEMARRPYVRLCYERPRRQPHWPYNLFVMIHGRTRDGVLDDLAAMRDELGLAPSRVPQAVLFSTRRFKQCGARYARAAA